MKAVLSERLKIRLQSSLSKTPRLARWEPRVVVLCYHSVHPSGGFPGTTHPDLFEQHMRWLREECDLISFARVREEGRRANRPRPAVAVTFDDGFADSHSHALPILLRHEIPATFFLATGLIDRDPDVIHARSWHGWWDEGSTLEWAQIVEMRRVGMDIGGHGHSHRVLAQLDDEEVVVDLSTCKEVLENRLAEPVVSFAYPKGRPRRDFSGRTSRLAQSLGYQRAAAILLRGVKASDGPMSIPRFPVDGDSLDVLQAKVWGRMDLIGLWQERAPLWMIHALDR